MYTIISLHNVLLYDVDTCSKLGNGLRLERRQIGCKRQKPGPEIPDRVVGADRSGTIPILPHLHTKIQKAFI